MKLAQVYPYCDHDDHDHSVLMQTNSITANYLKPSNTDNSE